MRGSPKKLPSALVLRNLFAYDQKTGILTWKVDRYPRKLIGNEAGWLDPHGRRCVEIDGVAYKVVRIIWKIMTGRDPNQEVDHINLIRNDDRWENLREASWSDNSRNRNKRSDSANPYKGIRQDKRWGRWYARIQIAGNKRFEIGGFATPEEAHKAYCEAAQKYHGDFARTA